MATESKRKAPLGRKLPARTTRRDGVAHVNVPEGKPGNTKIDQVWCARHASELEEVPEGAELPFGVKLRWAGEAPDIGAEFLLEDGEHACLGRAFVRDEEGRRIVDSTGVILTRPCAKKVLKGGVVCSSHGGLTPQSLEMARKRLMASADAVTGRLIWIAMNPHTVDKDAISAINSILDRAGIRAGVEVRVDTPEWQAMLKDMWEKSA